MNTEIIPIRMTIEQKQKIKKSALKNHLKLSTYIRQQVLKSIDNE